MRSYRAFSWLFALGLVASTVLPGCGDDDDKNTAGNGGTGGDAGTAGTSAGSNGAAGTTAGTAGTTAGTAGTTAGTAGTTAGTAGTTAGTSAGGTAGTSTGGTAGTTPAGDGNDSFDEAVELESGTPIQGTLEDPSTDVDFYSFTGNAGELWLVAAQAHSSGNETTAGYIDTFIQLYDASKTLIATNDDSYPRADTDSQLLTVLPTTGKYYVKVQEWCTSPTMSATACNSDYFDGLDHTDYAVLAAVNPAGPGTAIETEPNDTAATATPITFAPNTDTAGTFFLTVLQGKLPMSSDADWYSFTTPAAGTASGSLDIEAGSRANASFLFPWGTPQGNGTTIKTGIATVYAADMTTVLSSFDFTNEPETASGNRAELRVPVQFSTNYFIKITHSGTEATGTGDFYIAYETLGAGNPVENEANNDTSPGETLTTATGADASYFVEGDITAGDVDYFQVATTGLATISVSCASQRAGSGVRGFKATVLNGTTEITSKVEDPAPASDDGDPAVGGLFINHFVLPTPVPANLVIKLEATMAQDATNKGTSYLCGIVAAAVPAPN